MSVECNRDRAGEMMMLAQAKTKTKLEEGTTMSVLWVVTCWFHRRKGFKGFNGFRPFQGFRVVQ